MKKLVSMLLTVLMISVLAVSVFAVDRTPVTVYFNTPTLDGIIENGEWDKENAIDMIEGPCQAWGGEINNTVYFYYSWDEKGLYLAAQVQDTSVCLPKDTSEVYAKDAFQIALDPAGLLGKADVGGGMFFSVAVCSDGSLGAVYHPYGGAPEEFDYTGAGRIVDGGWEFEMLIPWTSIEILADDGYAWTHAEGEKINALIACLDRAADGSDEGFYKTVLPGVDPLDFTPANYALQLTLSKKSIPATESEQTAEQEDSPNVTDKAPKTADAGILISVMIMAVSAAYVVSKKH